MPLMPTLQTLQRELADCIIRCSHLDDIRILLACGAKVNEPVTQGLRPLHYAVYQQYHECVSFLLVRGADVDAMDDIGYTALHLCAERGYTDLLRLLLDQSARVKFTELKPDDRALGNPPRATLADEPLRLAIKNGHVECAEMLLKSGADPNARYFLGSEINLISPLNISFMELLLKHGADPDARDRAGLTPLMKACRHPQGYAAAKMLIGYGADPNAMTSERHDFRTVLHYAVLSSNVDIVRL
ncbi:Ankyrin repeat domain-containing protein 50-like protein, partial [Leptotrombidium deliense]